MLTWNVAESTALTEFQRARLMGELGPRIRVVATDERSQLRNRDIALERLRDRVRAALRVRAQRLPTAPTKSSVDRRLTEKRLRSERKIDRRARHEGED